MKNLLRALPMMGALFAASTASAAPKIEEVIVGPTDRGGSYVVSPSGAHVAYAGMKGSKFYVNVDGVDGPEFDELMKTGGQAYTFPTKAGIYIGQLNGLNAGDAPVLFTADGEHFAYTARRGDNYFVILDGREVGRGPRENLATGTLNGVLHLTPRGQHVWWADFEFAPKLQRKVSHLIVSGKRGPAIDGIVPAEPVFSADESHYAYVIGKAVDTGQPMLVLDGKDVGYAGDRPALTADGSVLLAVSNDPQKQGLLANGKLVYAGSVKDIVPAPAGRRWAAIVNKIPAAGGLPFTMLVVDGKEIAGTEHVLNVWFSPNGKRYAAVCHNIYGRHPFVMVVDGKGVEFPRIDPQPPSWTADSSKIIYSAGTDTGSALVVEDDVYTVEGTFGGLTLAERGDRYAWQSADIRRRAYFLVIGEDSVLPGGLYPMSGFVFSPDGRRHAYLAGQVGRNQVHGLVIDGALQNGVGPDQFFLRFSDRLDAQVPAVFSRDGRHVAFKGRPANANASAVYVDGQPVYPNARAIYFPAFTPDEEHFFWTADETTAASGLLHVLYLDGQPVIRANSQFFSPSRSFDLDAKGVASFLAADGNVAKRYRITPDPAVKIATLLEKGATVIAASPAAAASAPATAAAPPTARPTPKPAAAAATANTATAAPSPAPALTWNDLVRRPETRPTACTVNRDYRFQGGMVVRTGTTVNILEVKPGELVVGTPDGRVNFSVKPDETDVLAVANAAWAQLSPPQRELTYASLLQRTDLWPYQLKLMLPFELEGRRTRVGDPAILLGVENGQLLVRLVGTDIAFNVGANETDLMAQARAAVADGNGAPGRVLQEFAGKLVSPIDGRPVALDPAARPKYVVMYMGAAWCGPCQAFSPKLVKVLKDKSAKSPDVVVLYLSGDRSPVEAKGYVAKLQVDWPTLYFKNRGQLPAFGSLFGDVIPQLVVTDRHGKVLIDSSKSGYERALAQLNQLL